MKSLTFALAAVLFPSLVHAIGIRLEDQDAAAVARADAFTATADNPSAIYYNPAGITQLDGLNARSGLYGIVIDVDAALAEGDGIGSKEKFLVVPQTYVTFKPPVGPFTLGLGIYSPYGLTLEYQDDVPFRQQAKFGRIEFITVNPVIAMQVTRTLSVAIGADIDWAQADLRQGILGREFGGGDEFKFRGTGTTAGFNAGILWQPTEQHSFGVSYHSGVTVDFSGHSSARLSDKERHAARAGNEQVAAARRQVDAIEQKIRTAPIPASVKAQLVAQAESQFAAGLAAQGVPPGGFPEDLGPEQDADAKFRFPQYVMMGYSFRPTPQWNIEFDADWTDWDVLNTLHLQQQTGMPIDLPFNWRSSWIFKLGATRKFDNGYRLSAGYGFAENSVPNESFNPAVPDSDHHFFSAGIGHTAGKISWDMAYQLTYGPGRTIDNNTLADGRYRFISHAVTLSLGYHF